MTNPNPSKARSGNDHRTKMISTGLAVATGIGVVGLIGWRTAEEANAQNASDTATVSTETEVVLPVRSSDGYTVEQLDAYAAALQQETQRLSDYRDQLNALAEKLATASRASGKQVAVTPSAQKPAAQKPAAQKPAAQPAAKPAARPSVAPVPPTQKPAPQSNSQGS